MPKLLPSTTFRWGMTSILTMAMVVVITLFVTLTTVLDVRKERGIFHAELEQRGLLLAETLNEVLADPLYFTDIDELRDLAEVARSHPDITSVRVFRPDGRLLVSNTREDDQSDYPTGFADDQFGLDTLEGVQTNLRFRGDSLEVASPIEAGGEVIGVVQFEFRADSLSAEITNIVWQHVWQGLALIGIGVIISYVIARLVTKPLQSIAKVAKEIGEGNLDTPVKARGTRETVELGHALEGMKAQLKQFYSGLEQQVAARTRELSQANEALRNENIQRRRAEGELEKARDAALQASRAKSEFLSSMSHEIRTPMNAILGMSDLLAETPLTHEQQEYVRIARTGGENLLSLIDDILDLSKVEAGQLQMEMVELDVGRIVEETATFLAVRAHGKGLELSCRVMPEVPAIRLGDPVRLRQVLTNLVGNAIKFTERGAVSLSVKHDPAGEEGGDLLFRVSDTGIGIPPQRLDYIFDMFTQVDGSTTRHYGGTGLGLAICRRLVGIMGGTIWAESTPGEGSSFYFTARFPLSGVPSGAAVPERPDMKQLKMLVVDDSSNNRIILREVLGGWGAQVSEARDGEEALTKLAHAREMGEPYQLVLLDRYMPGKDGFQVAECIRGGPNAPGMTLMMLTSDNLHGDIDRCRRLGISRYLVKPVSRAELLHTVSSALGLEGYRAGEGASVVNSPGHEAQRPLSILLVEDSQDSQLLVRSYLKDTPHQIDTAENGAVAIERFTSGAYDLVLMDMQMPVMDWYTATRAIRKWEEEKRAKATPVIALTAHALKRDAQRSIDAGCTAHITKPIRKAKLMEAISTHARRTGHALDT